MSTPRQRFPRYGRLLSLYPVAYRKTYGDQMLQTLADMLDDPARSHTAVWGRLITDFPFSVLKQQLSYTGAVMATDTPDYLKRSARLGVWLVAPFFLLVGLHALAGSRLEHSWAWRGNVLFAWLVVLPSMAVVLNLQALLRWVRQRRRNFGTSSWRSLWDVRRNWPALGIVVLGLGILALVFFHDSVHCVAGNPIRELHNPRATIRCIQRG